MAGAPLAAFDAAMAALAEAIARAACDRVTLPTESLGARLGKTLGMARPDDERPEATRVRREMSARLDADVRASIDRLIAIHGLEGRAAGEVLERLATDVRVDAPLDEGKAAMMGGVVSGALTGLGADLASGGLTFGAGMLAGAVLGALGGAGVARGMNVVRGKTEATLRWETAFLDGLVTASLLRYLAVAHYGRGRGEWKESEAPAFWRESVAANRGRAAGGAGGDLVAADAGGAADGVDLRLRSVLAQMARELLDELYPGAIDDWRAGDEESLA